MSLNLNDVIEGFALVSGLGMDETSKYLTLINDCREYFEERQRDGLDERKLRRLAHACAVYAYYKVCLLRRDGGFGSFRAGDLQINSGTADELCECAERMWLAERESVDELIRIDDGFSFRSVEV